MIATHGKTMIIKNNEAKEGNDKQTVENNWKIKVDRQGGTNKIRNSKLLPA